MPEIARSPAPAAARIENGGRRARGRCGRSIVNLPGSFPAAAARSGGRIVRAVGSAYTAALGSWAPVSRPVRAVGGVDTGRRDDVVRKEGAQDGDSRSA